MFSEMFSKKPIVSVIRLSGVIGDGGRFKKGMTLESLAPLIHKAFNKRHIKAVALMVNSPGGSPVQSDLIAKRIRHYADEKNVPVWAFCEDAAASGGYWLACAADRIYAAPASIIGSIGVIGGGFGFPGLMNHLGIERRIYTSGKSKSQLDPFQPENEEDVHRQKLLMAEVHQQFIDYVTSRRGTRLDKARTDLFTGEYWTGTKAVDLGLADGVGDLRTVMRREFGPHVRFKLVEPKKKFFDGIRPFAANTSSWSEDLVGSVVSAAIEHTMWSRFGL